MSRCPKSTFYLCRSSTFDMLSYRPLSDRVKQIDHGFQLKDMGIEPMACSLASCRSITELGPRWIRYWWSRAKAAKTAGLVSACALLVCRKLAASGADQTSKGPEGVLPHQRLVANLAGTPLAASRPNVGENDFTIIAICQPIGMCGVGRTAKIGPASHAATVWRRLTRSC